MAFDLKAKFLLDVRNALSGFKRVQKETKATTDDLKDMGDTGDDSVGLLDKQLLKLGAGFSTLVVAKQIADISLESYKAAGALEGLERGYIRLSRQAGINSDKLLRDMTAVARGTIKQEDIFRNMNTAILLGGADLARALPTLTGLAKRSAEELGGDIDYMMNSIVTGIVRGSKPILDNLAIILDMQGAYERYATEIGKTVGQLTEQEKVTARVNEVIREYGQGLGGAGDDALTASEGIAAMTKATDDLKVEWGKLLISIGTPAAVQGTASTLGNIASFVELRGAYTEVHKAIQQYVLDLQEQGRHEEAAEIDAKRAASLKTANAKLTAENTRSQTNLLNALLPLPGATNNIADAYSGAINPTTDWAVAQGILTQSSNELAASLLGVGKAMAIGFGQASYQGRKWLVTANDMNSSQIWDAAEAGGPDADLLVQNVTGGMWTSDENRILPEKAGEEAAEAYSQGAVNAFNRLQGDISSAVMMGLDVKDSDFGPDYMDAPLEAVRRLRDVANLGTASPWASMFEIPADVLAQGEEAVKRWAAGMAERGAELRDISLIDKEAFLRELGEIQNAAAEQEGVMKQLTQWALDAGLAGSQTEASAMVGTLFGDASLATAGALTDGLKDQLSKFDAGVEISTQWSEQVSKQRKTFMGMGRTIADDVVEGFTERIGEIDFSSIFPQPTVYANAFGITESNE